MNKYLENAFNGPFDWEKWEFDLRETILNQNDQSNTKFDKAYYITLNNDIIGFIWISKQSEEIYWIDTFVILENYRRKGIGKKVFEAILATIKKSENNFSYIDLGVQEINLAATNFYEKLGFYEITDISMAYYKTKRMRYNLL